MELSRHPSQRPPTVGNSDGLRIARLCGMLVLVIALMGKAGNSESWRWMWRMGPTSVTQQVALDTLPNPITAAVEHAPEGVQTAAQTTASSTALWLPQVNRELLSSIQDNTVFRRQETEVWYHLFGLLQELSQHKLQSFSNGQVTYLQLLRQTDAYRGQLVEIRGVLRRAVQVRAAKNELGLEYLWQCWIFLNDGPHEPVVVYSLNLPEQTPRGMSVEADVDALGFVYKRWSFETAAGLTVAPVLLTKELTLRSVPPTSPDAIGTNSAPTSNLLPRIIVLAMLGILTAVWLMHRATRLAMPAVIVRRWRARNDDAAKRSLEFPDPPKESPQQLADAQNEQEHRP